MTKDNLTTDNMTGKMNTTKMIVSRTSDKMILDKLTNVYKLNPNKMPLLREMITIAKMIIDK